MNMQEDAPCQADAPLRSLKSLRPEDIVIRDGVRYTRDTIIAQVGGLRVVKPGLRLDRYRQGV